MAVQEKHRHNWQFQGSGWTPWLKCIHCGLSVEVFSDHVSVYDYSRPGDLRWLGAVRFPVFEDEEEVASGREANK